MSKFVSNQVKKIELGDGEWVKVFTRLSVSKTQIFQKSQETNDLAGMVISCIEEWNLKDEEGKEAKLEKEMVEQLDIKVATKILEGAMAALDLKGDNETKKKDTTS